MPFQLSPGVQVIEKDFTSIIPVVSASTGAICGPFLWGPVNDPIRISSENELVNLFGKPTSANFASWFTASNFLSYSNSAYITRSNTGSVNAVSTPSGVIAQARVKTLNKGMEYADNTTIALTFSPPTLAGGVTATGTATWDGDTSGVGNWTVTITNPGSGYVRKADGTPDVAISVPDRPSTTAADASFYVEALDLSGLLIKNLEDYTTNFSGETTVHGLFAAKFPGSKANGVRIYIVDNGNYEVTPANIISKLGRPGTSAFAASKGVYDDELHVLVYDTPEGSFSGTPNALLESWPYLSKMSDAKREDGTSIYWKTYLNANSKYVWHLRNPGSNSLSEFFGGEGADGSFLISGGTTGIQFVASTKKIIITDNAKFANLSAFKSFFDAAEDKASRQIVVTNSLSNNYAYTVVSVIPTLSGLTVTGYEITVAESLVNETVSSPVNAVNIRSLIKMPWGYSSEQAQAYIGNQYFPVVKNTGDAFVNGYISTLSRGTDVLTATQGAYQESYSLLSNPEQYDISLLPIPNVSASLAQWIVNNVVEVRKDCMAFVSPNTAATGLPDSGSVLGQAIMPRTGSTQTADTLTFKTALGLNTSYAVMDSGFKYMYDRYNDTYRWVPLSGDMAGLCARTDNTTDPWFSPGGFNRGQVKNIIKLSFNPTQSQRDELYPNGVNPVVTFRGQGTVLYGDKTLLAKPSAFDRINVRRLFIVLEKAIATASRFQMFEFNDTFTRAQFKNLVEPFLRDIQGRRGVTDFRVVCDETNNTGEVIDRNEFVADIYIKPNRSINFITLNFIAARSSVSFEELGA